MVETSCNGDFPSISPDDASVVESVKALVDDADCINKIVRPTRENQAAYNFFFVLRDISTKMPFVQLIDLTLSAGDSDSKDFTQRYVHQLKKAEALPWNELGIDAKKIVFTFISYGDTSGVNWATEFKQAGFGDRRILVLGKADLKAFYGPMLNLLFSICFEDDENSF